MSIVKPASPGDLYNYILWKLGKDVVNIEMGTTHIDIAINDAMDMFYGYAFDGYEEVYLDITLPITATTASAVSTYTMGTSILSVVGIYGRMQPYEAKLATMVLDSSQIYGNKPYSFEFNQTSHTVTIFEQLDTSIQVLAHCYRKLDAVTYTDIYNHPWLKKYAVALAKYQWGWNINKYGNVILPGGMTLNSGEILAEAKEEITNLKEELFSEWVVPPLPSVY